jgi:NAD(P)H-flavin reductase
MFLSSFGLIRRLAYEAFIALHICLGITLLVALYHHRPMYRHWIYASMIIWGFDRAVSFLKAAYANLSRKNQAEVTLLGPDTVRVVAHAPKLKWRAGQHAFLIMPSVARLGLESHPFTMTNVPNESGEAVFIVRAHTGFTRRLVDHLQSSEGQVKCFIDGPYGLPPMLDHYGGVLLIAGGTGITYALSHLLGIAKAARAGKCAVASARLVWNVRERDDPISWISPLLKDLAADGLRVHIDVHLTSHGSGEPTDPAPGEHESGDGKASPGSDPEKAVSSDTGHDGLLTIKHGRSDIEATLRSDIAGVPGDAGGMAVVVCGPTSLALDTRRAVCRVNSAGAVAKGQVPIEFYAEKFGW